MKFSESAEYYQDKPNPKVSPNSRDLSDSPDPHRVSDKTAYSFYFSELNPPAFSPDLLFQKDLFYAGADRPDRHRLGFVWAKNRRAGNCFSGPSDSSGNEQLGGIELHNLLDHDGHIPAFVQLTGAKTEDLIVAKLFKLPSGSITVMDRA
jgi:hypothetical protein